MSHHLLPWEQTRAIADQMTARRMNDIQRAIPKVRYSGTGARVSNLGGQTFVEIPRPRYTPPFVQTPVYTPFQIFYKPHISGGTPDGTFDVYIYPGLIGDNLPSNYSALINSSLGSTQFVVLTVNTDGYTLTSSNWSLASSPPSSPTATADTPPSTVSTLIGLIGDDPGTVKRTIYQLVNSNLTCNPIEWVRQTRAGAGPFELPYVIFYTWNIQGET